MRERVLRVGINGLFWGQETTGSGQYLHRLSAELARLQGVEPHLFLPKGVPRRSLPCLAHPLPIPVSALGENLSKLFFEQWVFPRVCRRLGMEVAHVPYFAPPLWASLPIVVTIHDLIPLILPAYRRGWHVQAYMHLVARAAQRATLVLTDSQASARDIRRLLRIPPERLRVIPLAADEAYHPLSPEEQVPTHRRLGLPERYLLYLGGFDQRKNVLPLLEAFAQALPQLEGVSLVIAGRLPRQDSAFTPDPRPLAQRLGIAQHVHFIGWVEEKDKPALYAGALGFLFPSAYEGFGLPVLEAISCGTPAIIGAGSALEEVAGPGGLVVPPGNVPALARAIYRLVQDSNLRQRLAQDGLAHAQRFSWRRTAEQTLAAYREAVTLCKGDRG